MYQQRRTQPEIHALMAALRETRMLLRKHGDKFASARLDALEARLARGDWMAVESAVSEATGGMGSLRDRVLSAANGDAITRPQETAVNAQLDALITEGERTARNAAAAIGIQLFR